MDPYTRRFLWETLKQAKLNRAIILTTHFMEEADFLADRVAMMSQGKIMCVGSPYFLKCNLGEGYTFRLVKGSEFNREQESMLTKMLADYVPGSQIVSKINSEILFTVPFAEVVKVPK